MRKVNQCKMIRLLVLFVCIATPDVNAWMWSSSWSWPWSSSNDTENTSPHQPKTEQKPNCLTRRTIGDRPFYIGRTNLMCMLYYRRRRKRNVPSVYTLILTHRWVKYRGIYFEFGTNALNPRAKNRISIQPFKPSEGEHCSYDENPDVAGYSKLSTGCIAACTHRYPKVFGEYSLLTNNCHVFVNKIVEVLCESYDKCPSWCTAQ